jgi:hypothetical protein
MTVKTWAFQDMPVKVVEQINLVGWLRNLLPDSYTTLRKVITRRKVGKLEGRSNCITLGRSVFKR